MNGFLNVLKPPGMSSAAVVGFVKRRTGEKHVGHAGTLDPDAAGVLPVMVGKSTRLFDYLVEKEKEYVCTCAFGIATDTQDASGTVIAKGDNYPALDAVKTAVLSLTGDIIQRPSMYSAIKMGGKPLYELAREGETVDVPERTVHVERIDVLGETDDHGVMLRVLCGRGTYIRSICDDLGKLVGCPAHMRSLIRSMTGIFDIAHAVTLEEIDAAAQDGTLKSLLVPCDGPIAHMNRVDVPDWLEKPLRNGMPLIQQKIPSARSLQEGDLTRMYMRGQFWGIAQVTDGALVWRALISPEE